MIAVIDYDTGNLRSVANALGRLGAEFILTGDPATICSAERVLLPGVGEASSAMARLRERGLVEVIKGLTQPVLGICIGVQLMCRRSEEGTAECMGIFDTDVRRLGGEGFGRADTMRGNDPESEKGGPVPGCGFAVAGNVVEKSPNGIAADFLQSDTPQSGCVAGTVTLPSGLKVPEMGWNTITDLKTPLFSGLDEGAYVYYVHSFAPQVCAQTIARTHYGADFSAALGRDNFFGTQFHPEKSGNVGERILRNFLELR